MADAYSGQITVESAGTEVQGPDFPGGQVAIKALPGNTGVVYVGNDGTGAVDANSGYALGAGEEVTVQVPNLNLLWFDASADNQGAAWLRLGM